MPVLHLVWIMPSYSRKTINRMHTKINIVTANYWLHCDITLFMLKLKRLIAQLHLGLLVISTEGIPVNYHIQQSSNVKLFGVHRIRETAKLLQFLELMKATFDCGGNIRQRSVGVRRHERNSLDPRKDDFLKLMMQSSSSFMRDARLDCL